MTVDRIIIVGAFILGCVSMLTWEYFKEVHGIRIYYVSIAIEFTLIYYAYSLTQQGRFKTVCDAITSVCFAKVIDELFFDPTIQFEIGEITITVLGFLFLVFQQKLKKRLFKTKLYAGRIKRGDRKTLKDK